MIALFATVACSSMDASTLAVELVPTPSAPSTQTPADSDLLPLAPVFSVSTIDCENIRLEDLLGIATVYLLFVPSTIDELDISQIRIIQSNISEFDELCADVVVVVSVHPTRVIEIRNELGLDFPLIADPAQRCYQPIGKCSI